jgi:MauM/NapG family ferredoxin protein
MAAKEKRRDPAPWWSGFLSWRRLRRASQILALLLFLYLLLDIRLGGEGWLPHDLFFRLNPLAGMAAMLAARQWILPLALGAMVLGLTVVLGRAWCGWICPLGTILDWARPPRRFRRPPAPSSRWRQAKYLVLFAILFSALLGSLAITVLDPITLLHRSITSAILPAAYSVVTWSEKLLYRFGPLQTPLDHIDGFLRDTILPLEQPFYLPGLVALAVLAGVLALNAVRPRFWCRYLCPLGGLLGLISRISLVRHAVDNDACTACRRCARSCSPGAIRSSDTFVADPAECTLCLDCLEACPTGAISFRTGSTTTDAAPGGVPRRTALASMAAVGLGVGLLRLAPVIADSEPPSLRPPGTSESDLRDKCIRCGQCINVCPTGALQAGVLGAGYDGLWTPVMIPRHGYCDFGCRRCGEVCPTGAIPLLSLEEKRQAVIGKAEIDKHRCIPWADGQNCIVCQEMCPLTSKAIELTEVTAANSEGYETALLLPEVIRGRCTGCGICEHQCPVRGEAAIRVHRL